MTDMTKTALKQSEQQKDFPWVKNYPPGLAWKLDIPEKSLQSLLDEAVTAFSVRPALSFAGFEYDYKTLGALVGRAARGLQNLGVKKGVKVGLFMSNAAYSVVMYYAILKAGGTVVNYNPVYVETDLINQVEDSETDIIVTLDVPMLIEKSTALLEKTRVERIIVCPARQQLEKTSKTMDSLSGEEYVWFCDLIANAGDVAKVVIDPKTDIAVLQYTGGTTGVPKGAALTHYCLVANTLQIGQWYHNTQNGQDSMVAVLPLFHVFAMTVVMNWSLWNGVKILMQPKFDVNDVLDLSRIEAGQLPVSPEVVDLAEVAGECCTMLRAQSDAKGVELQLSPRHAADGTRALVRADRVRLRQVLLNLLSNAVKYNRPGGTARVEWDQRATHWEVRVIDNGVGMTDAQQVHLFEPFNRLGAERSGVEGTGIGLVLARHLAQLMGGDLHLTSRSDRGTTAILTLEAARTPAIDKDNEVQATLPASLSHSDGSVMLVLSDWAQRIVTLNPNADALVPLAWPYKVHMVLGMTIFLVFPFTRLVHMLSAPVWYLNRRGWQIVRSKKLAAGPGR